MGPSMLNVYKPILAALVIVSFGLAPSKSWAQSEGSTQVASPERLELGAQMVRASHLDKAASLALEVAWRSERDKVVNLAKSLPPDRARKALAAWDNAVQEGQTTFVEGLSKRLQLYFATSKATDAQLQAYVSLYDSDLGRRIAPPNVASAEDRQAAGKYLMDHPGALDALPIVLGATDIVSSYSAEHKHALSVEVGQHFCRGLYEAGIAKTPKC
jgi:hypothetical protein